MSRSRMLLILIALLALPAAAAGTRIRVENTSSPGARVTISFADASRIPARLETGDDGTAQLVVEAPSPRLRLRGGTLQTDPRIDALARQQLRESSSAPRLLVMSAVDSPARFPSFDGPLVYDDWGGWWGAPSWGGGYGGPVGPGRAWDIPVAREIPRDHPSARPPSPARPQGSFSARGVMPRAGRQR